MEVGIVMPCSAITPPQLIAETAKAIEERGFASIWAPEHVIFFEEYRSNGFRIPPSKVIPYLLKVFMSFLFKNQLNKWAPGPPGKKKRPPDKKLAPARPRPIFYQGAIFFSGP